MNSGEYIDSALFILSLQPMSGYELARKLKWDGTMVSGGTIRPLLKSLEKNGFITFEMRGRAKVYRLTQKGERYVSNLRVFKETIREKMIAYSFNREILFPDILTDIGDTKILNEAIEKMAKTIVKEVKIAFVMYKKGDIEGLDYLIELIDKAMKDAKEMRKIKQQ